MLSLLFASIFVCLTSVVAFASDVSPARLDEAHRVFLKEHCVECHNADKQKGKLRLDDLSFALDTVERADRWQKILNQINSGEMPPEEAKQPEGKAKTDFLEALSAVLVSARRSLGDSGGKVVVRRLNRREYKNTIRDLLGVEIDVHGLPADGAAGAFDTVGASLFMSSDQVEQYLALGRRALDDAFARHAAEGKQFKIRHELEKIAESQLSGSVKFLTRKVEPYNQWTSAVDAACRNAENKDKADALRTSDEVVKEPQRFYRHWSEFKGAPAPTAFGFKDAGEAESLKHQFDEETGNAEKYFQLPHVDTGSYLFVFIVRPQESIVVPKDWPPGQYTLRVRIAAVEGTPAERHFIEVGHPTQPGAFDIISTHQITGLIENPQIVEVPVTLTSTGSRTFAIREKRLNSREHEVALAVLYQKKHKTWYPPAMWIDWMEFEGPQVDGHHTAGSGRLFSAKSEAVSDSNHARLVIEDFASRAFRDAAPDAAFIDGLVRLFERRRSRGETYESAIKETLSAVLAAPGFLYLREPNESGKERRLSDLEMATRLSYFLWSAPPDEDLLKAARTGALRSREELEFQLRRMIADSKANEFVSGFVNQWLGLERLDFFRFNARLFPEFDDSAKMAARQEVYETFGHLLRGNGSLTRMLKSDQVVINGLLANLYGIGGVTGDVFRPVFVPPDSPRGGLLGMSAIMAMGSNGERTSPVERGAWVLRKLLHEPPPPAPPNIPQLSRLAEKNLSPRERVLAHQEEPQCRQCHRKIDPIGFGLENFNTIGQWRTTELYAKADGARKDWPIVASGALHHGPAFNDFFELRDIVASRSASFARGFSEALFEYATGRAVSFVDESLINSIVEEAAQKDFAVPAFIQALVCSQAFQHK